MKIHTKVIRSPFELKHGVNEPRIVAKVIGREPAEKIVGRGDDDLVAKQPRRILYVVR